MTEIAPEIEDGRQAFASKYARGCGLEVGALDAPYPVDRDVADVTYVDRFAKPELLRQYPELLPTAGRIVDPGVIDDGERLATIADGSQDFVIASHFLEHCENPIATLRHHCRVLRPGGFLILAVPNTANPQSFDHGRTLTSFDHLVRDDREGPGVSRDEHFDEWVTFTGGMLKTLPHTDKATLMAMNYSIHFHCWQAAGFYEFLDQAIAYGALPLERVDRSENQYEIAAVLRKTATRGWLTRLSLSLRRAG